MGCLWSKSASCFLSADVLWAPWPLSPAAAAGRWPLTPRSRGLDLLNVVSGEHPLSAPQPTEPPTRRIWNTEIQQSVNDPFSQFITEPISSSINSCTRTSSTFSEYLDDIISVEAELIRVLGVVGVQRSALWRPGLRSGGWFWSTRSRNRFHLLWPPPLQPVGITREYSL